MRVEVPPGFRGVSCSPCKRALGVILAFHCRGLLGQGLGVSWEVAEQDRLKHRCWAPGAHPSPPGWGQSWPAGLQIFLPPHPLLCNLEALASPLTSSPQTSISNTGPSELCPGCIRAPTWRYSDSRALVGLGVLAPLRHTDAWDRGAGGRRADMPSSTLRCHLLALGLLVGTLLTFLGQGLRWSRPRITHLSGELCGPQSSPSPLSV